MKYFAIDSKWNSNLYLYFIHSNEDISPERKKIALSKNKTQFLSGTQPRTSNKDIQISSFRLTGCCYDVTSEYMRHEVLDCKFRRYCTKLWSNTITYEHHKSVENKADAFQIACQSVNYTEKRMRKKKWFPYRHEQQEYGLLIEMTCHLSVTF